MHLGYNGNNRAFRPRLSGSDGASHLNHCNPRLQRRSALVAAIAVALVPGGVLAAQPQLRLVSPAGASSSTAKTVRTTSVRFAPASKTLTVSTRAGNVDCGTPGTVPADGYKLLMDGVTYPLNTSSGLPSEFAGDPMVYSPSTGFVSVSPASAPALDCGSANQFPAAATGEHYDLVFEGQQPLDIAEAVYYQSTDRSFEIRVADPVLCTSYGSGQVTVALADPNDPDFAAPQILGGFESMQFAPSALSFAPRSSRPPASEAPRVQCSTPGVNSAPSNSPSLFFSGFELAEGSADVDVRILLAGNPASQLGRNAGESAELVVRVANTGVLPAKNVRIREYAPQAGAYGAGMADIRLTSPGGDQCVITGGTAACPETGSGNLGFPLSFDIATLEPGESRDFVLHRSAVEGASGQSALFGFAAFVDPTRTVSSGPDLKLSDNASWASFAVS